MEKKGRIFKIKSVVLVKFYFCMVFFYKSVTNVKIG
jgi:hypothetical protein